MRVSLAHRSIPFESQVPVQIFFEGVAVARARIDLIVAKQIVLELKAVHSLQDVHFAQLRSYLRAAKLRIGLVLDFNCPTLARRIVVG